MRVVLDTNILVSFAIRHNITLEKMFDYLALHGTTLVCEETILELFTVLNREKFRRYISRKNALDYVEWYAGISEFSALTHIVSACRDSQDDKFL